MEELVDGPGSAGRREMWAGGEEDLGAAGELGAGLNSPAGKTREIL